MKDRINQFFEQLSEQWQAFWAKQVLQNPVVQQASGWYNGQNQRDQLIVKAVLALLVLALVIVLVYAPLLKGKKNAQAELQRNLTTYNLIASNAGKFGRASASGNQTGSILASVTNQAKAQNINLSRYEQDGSNLRVWLDRVVFDDAISWLETLESKHSIVVSQITVDATNSVGRVDIRATLAR